MSMLTPRIESFVCMLALLLLLTFKSSGKYQSSEGQSSCIDCPPGYSCPVNSMDKVVCDPGYVSEAKAAVCDPCPGGKYQPNSGQSECLECEAGYECPPGSIDQNICVAGTYSELGAASCAQCDAGRSTNGRTAQSECTLCPPGFSTERFTGSATCTICEGNFYNEEAGAPECTPCAGG